MMIVSDLHTGNYFGLTPPGRGFDPASDNFDQQKIIVINNQVWNWWSSEVAKVQAEKKINLLVLNGDIIDGKGVRSEGVELYTTDRIKQAEMAAEALSLIKADKVLLTFGTDYHTGSGENFEAALSRHMKIDHMADKFEFNVFDTTFNIRHHIGSSSVPHGRWTPIAKEVLWNDLKAERETEDRADILIRSHVHYHVYGGDSRQLAMTTPCLQAPGSRYGTRRMSGIIDIGFIIIDIEEGSSYSWRMHPLVLKFQSENKLQF